MKMIISRLVLFVSILTLILFFYTKPSFYVVNYYNKDGLYKQELKFGFSQDQCIYEDFELSFSIEGKNYKVISNFSENVQDVLKKIKCNKLFLAYKDNKVFEINQKASSKILEGKNFYIPKQLIVVFNNKKYKLQYFSFYSHYDIKNMILKKTGLYRKDIKRLDFVDLESGFIPVSNDLPKVIGVNIGWTKESYETISFSTKFVYTNSLCQGKSRILREGKNGKIKKVYYYYMEYSGEVSKELIDTKIVEYPIDRVVEIGIAPIQDLNQNKYYIMEATAYTAGVGGVDYYTSTGNKVRRGIAAVDPSIIPLGSRIYVEGYGYADALDVGSAIKGFKIDLYFESYKEAILWGRRKVKVYLIK